MTNAAKAKVQRSRETGTNEALERSVDRFARLVAERVQSLAQGNDRAKIIALAERALREARATFSEDAKRTESVLPVSRLKAADVISQGLVDLSQASLYRSVESKRFYCTTPKGRSIGREFPAWQFVEPVPELLEAILSRLSELPSSEIHTFWVTAVDDLNGLSPAEVLAGKPFETRSDLHASQQVLMAQPANTRQHKVQQAAELFTKGMADIIG